MRRPEIALLVIGIVAVVAVVMLGTADPPEGPVEPVWDHARCARCGMLVSEPRFAAQIQRRDGKVLHFDDPGCLLLHEAGRDGALGDAHAVWFHHAEASRWVPLRAVGFVAAEPTPMDFGLAAVEHAERDDALGPEAARARARARLEATPASPETASPHGGMPASQSEAGP